MKKHFTYLLAGIAIATLTACGGGGSGASSTPASISGAVMDGYLTGATICLDINANLLCDIGEPTATSQAKGAWNFNIPAGTDTSKLHIIAVINANTIDTDTGTVPQQGYTLLAPATAATVVTPLTTLVSHTLIESPGLTLSQAQAQVISNANLPAGTKFDEDYVAKSNTSAHNVAKLIADVLGQSATTVNATSAPSSDAEKGAAIMVALTQAKGQVAVYAQRAASAANETDLQTLRTSAKTATFAAITSDTTISDSVKSAAKLGTPQPVNLLNKFSNGGMFAIWQSMICSATTSCFASVTYEQVYASDSTHVVAQDYFASKGSTTWGARPTQDIKRYIANTTTNTWIEDPSSNGTIAISDNGLSGVFTNAMTNSSRSVSTSELDISGKNSRDLVKRLKGACSATSITSATSVCLGVLDFDFPADSKLFVNTYYQNEPEYTLWTCQSCAPKTLDEVIASANGKPNLVEFGGATAKFDTSEKKVSLFDYDQTTPLASGTYQIQTIAGLRVLSINITSVQTPEKWFNSNDRDKYTINYIWIEREGKVLIGRKLDAGTTSNSTYLNRTAADALLKALDYPATLP